MENLEQRISQLESELGRVARQNRQMRLFMTILSALCALPFVLGWSGGSDGNFDLVRAKQIQIQNSSGRTTVLIGSTSALGSGPAGGYMFVSDPAGQTVAQLDGFSNNGGTLKLLEAGTPITSANTGLVQLAVERFGSTGKPRGVVKLFSENRGSLAVQLQASPGVPGEISIQNPSRDPIVRIGRDPVKNGFISVKDRDGKSEVLLEAVAESTLGGRAAIRGVQILGGKSQPRAPGGSLTLKGPSGNVTFKAPGDAKTPSPSLP